MNIKRYLLDHYHKIQKMEYMNLNAGNTGVCYALYIYPILFPLGSIPRKVNSSLFNMAARIYSAV